MTNNDKFTNLATLALYEYGLENAQLTRLGGADNINFRVDIDDKSYVLHLHLSQRHDQTAIASMLAWLTSLQDTLLVLPRPIVNIHKELVTSVADGQTEALSTLMTWLEGQIPPTVDTLTDEQIAKVGSLMAQLHIHSQQFKPPNGFKRHTFDEAYFSKRLEVLLNSLYNTELNKSVLNRFKTHANKIITHFAQLERKQADFGLIHADFHSGNYLLCGEELHLIDFDRCGFGFYLYDLMLALMELGEKQRSFFLQGYEQVKPLPNNYKHLKQMFLCLAYLDNLGFLAANPEELAFILAEMTFVVEAFRNAVEILPSL